MKLYLIRHGAAQWTTPDADRELSLQGRSESLKLIEKHSQEWPVATHLFVSPLKRAQQSAELLSPFLSVDIKTHTSPNLEPEFSVVKLTQWLEEQSFDSHSRVVLIAHNPLLSKLLNRLLDKPNGFYQLGTSAIAMLELEVFAQGCATLGFLESGY